MAGFETVFNLPGENVAMRRDQIKSLGISTALILLNIAVMWGLSFTVFSTFNDLLFGEFFLLGVVVYGALLSGGVWLARKGIRSDDVGKAAIGTVLIQAGYGIFGAGIIGSLSAEFQAVVLGVTAAVTAALSIGAGLLVFGTDHDFSKWGRYANYLFLGVLGVSIVGSFSPMFIGIAFVMALLGFILYLVHEVYQVKIKPGRPVLNAIGLYTAFMGVFVQILQIIVELLASRE